MIKDQQSLNEVIEMRQQIQEAGEMMVYLTQVKLQKDISQINKQFQQTLMNKIIPKDLYEFFHRNINMDKKQYENEMYQFNEDQVLSKYMQTFQVIYNLLSTDKLNQQYIDFLLNIINNKPEYTKPKPVILMYRRRLTGIIMMEHYLKYKNANTILNDFNNVWNSLYSNIFCFNRKHQQLKINFSKHHDIAARYEQIIRKCLKQSMDNQDSQSKQPTMSSNKSLFRATGLKKQNDSSNESNGSQTQKLNENKEEQYGFNLKINKSGKQSKNSTINQNEQQNLNQYNQFINNQPDSDSIENSINLNSNKKSEMKRKLEVKNKICIQNIINDTEQEVSILIKNHYMTQLNIQIPEHGFNLQNQENREYYLHLSSVKKRIIVKKIDENKHYLDQLVRLQAHLYEVCQSESSASYQQKINDKQFLESCKKQESNFAMYIQKTQNVINEFQQHISLYNNQISNKIKQTFDACSQPVIWEQEESQLDTIIYINDDNQTDSSVEEIDNKQFVTQQNKNITLSHYKNQSFSITSETIKTRSQSNNQKNSYIYEISNSDSLISINQDNIQQTTPIKKYKEVIIENKSARMTQFSEQYDSRYDKQFHSKNHIKGNTSSLNNSKDNNNIFNSNCQVQPQNGGHTQSIIICDNQQNRKQQQDKPNIQKVISKEKSYIKNQKEVITIKSDYEKQQDIFKNYHIQFKTLGETLITIKEELEQVIYYLKTYQHSINFLSNPKANNFLDVQKATLSQLDKCLNFLENTQKFNETINFIENQYCYFPNSSDLPQSYQIRLNNKLKISKQIVYQQDFEQLNEQKSKKQKISNKIPEIQAQNQNNSEILNIEGDIVNECDPSIVKASILDKTSSFDQNAYIHSLKLFYQPHSRVLDPQDSLERTTQNNITFQMKFFEESNQFYHKFQNCLLETKLNIIDLLKNKEQLKKLFTQN